MSGCSRSIEILHTLTLGLARAAVCISWLDEDTHWLRLASPDWRGECCKNVLLSNLFSSNHSECFGLDSHLGI